MGRPSCISYSNHILQVRNTDGNAQLQVREDCRYGDLHMSTLKLRRYIHPEQRRFPATSSNYFCSKRDISNEKLSDMHTMYSRFIDPEKWPDRYLSHTAVLHTQHLPKRRAHHLTTTYMYIDISIAQSQDVTEQATKTLLAGLRDIQLGLGVQYTTT